MSTSHFPDTALSISSRVISLNGPTMSCSIPTLLKRELKFRGFTNLPKVIVEAGLRSRSVRLPKNELFEVSPHLR